MRWKRECPRECSREFHCPQIPAAAQRGPARLANLARSARQLRYCGPTTRRRRAPFSIATVWCYSSIRQERNLLLARRVFLVGSTPTLPTSALSGYGASSCCFDSATPKGGEARANDVTVASAAGGRGFSLWRENSMSWAMRSHGGLPCCLPSATTRTARGSDQRGTRAPRTRRGLGHPGDERATTWWWTQGSRTCARPRRPRAPSEVEHREA
mmetsp:Transcript_2532/g.8662  ORF Transcript_2532/g.8662 Transcript_2532/m.8662 type:complete len:213 (-) Transcript_2532:485-1123(-)